MTAEIPTIAEINRNAEAILLSELGVANTLRFFSQFSSGIGDYTSERHQWLDDLTLDEIVRDIEEHRKAQDRPTSAST